MSNSNAQCEACALRLAHGFSLLEVLFATTVLVVALTGLGTPEDRDRAKDAGFDTHLVKPVDLDALARILETMPSGG